MSDPRFAPASRKQQMMLTSNAKITITGGAAGSGKSHIATCLRHLRFVDDPNYRGYIIRKNETVLSKQGGLFDACVQLYKAFDPKVKYTKRPMVFYFPSGATIALSNYESDKSSEIYRGLELSSVAYDEVTEANESHVWTLIQRLRGKSKYKTWFIGTCNPNADSWLLEWVRWYLYPEGHELAGRPNPEKDGIIRYINNINGRTVFTDTVKEMQELNFEKTGEWLDENLILSFTFISANCEDNPPLLKMQPDYLGNLKSQPRVERERLLYGNWFARQEASGLYKREWHGELLNQIKTTDIKSRVRCWDLAGSLPSEVNPNPDWTAGVMFSRDIYGVVYIEDVIRFRARYGEVISKIAEVALRDNSLYGKVQQYIPIEPASHGKVSFEYHRKELATYGIRVKGVKVGTKSKTTRFEPFSASCEVGNVRCVKGDWNSDYFEELEKFNGSRNQKDDQVDATSDAFNVLAQNRELTKIRMEVFTR